MYVLHKYTTNDEFTSTRFQFSFSVFSTYHEVTSWSMINDQMIIHDSCSWYEIWDTYDARKHNAHNAIYLMYITYVCLCKNHMPVDRLAGSWNTLFISAQDEDK
jgi:hypothetical protein